MQHSPNRRNSVMNYDHKDPDDPKLGNETRGAFLLRRLSSQTESKRIHPSSNGSISNPSGAQMKNIPEEEGVDDGEEWKKNLSKEELERAEEWEKQHEGLAEASHFLNSPHIIIFWILLLITDMVVLFWYMKDEAPLWATVFGYVVSTLFALDLFSRLYLHHEQFMAYATFWLDRMNILDGGLVLIDVVTIALTIALQAAAARQGGAVKSARSLRLIRVLRGFRSVRVLRMGRIFKIIAKDWNWIVYQIDSRLQSNVWKGFGMMVLIMLFMILFGAIFYMLEPQYVDDDSPIDFEHAVWEMWGFMADPGTHADICDRFAQLGCLELRFFSGVVAIFGICYFAAVLGFVVDGIRDFLDDLKRGTRAVVEADHIVILGWSDKTVALVSELCDALESEGGGTIVVMDELEKYEMDDRIRPFLTKKDLRGSTVVTRKGSPMIQPDLIKVSAHQARALVVLAHTGLSADASDATAVRTVLALKGLDPPLKGHVVIELMDVDNRSIVELIGDPLVETVVSHDIIGRLMLLAARNPGVNSVYDEVFGFERDEFYLKAWPELVGRTFGDISRMFEDAVPLGFKRANRKKLPWTPAPGSPASMYGGTKDGSGFASGLKGVDEEEEHSDPDWIHTRDGRFVKYGMEVNPPKDSRMEAGDELLVLAADDDTYEPLPEPLELRPQPKVKTQRRVHKKDRTLVCGWRRDIDDMIVSLDAEVRRGSELHILCQVPVEQRIERLRDGGFDAAELKNLSLVHHVGNSAVRRVLEQLPLATFHYVLILADEEREDRPLDSDAHNLATLLLLRDLRRRQEMANRVSAKAKAHERLQQKGAEKDLSHSHHHRNPPHNSHDDTNRKSLASRREDGSSATSTDNGPGSAPPFLSVGENTAPHGRSVYDAAADNAVDADDASSSSSSSEGHRGLSTPMTHGGSSIGSGLRPLMTPDPERDGVLAALEMQRRASGSDLLDFGAETPGGASMASSSTSSAFGGESQQSSVGMMGNGGGGGGGSIVATTPQHGTRTQLSHGQGGVSTMFTPGGSAHKAAINNERGRREEEGIHHHHHHHHHHHGKKHHHHHHHHHHRHGRSDMCMIAVEILDSRTKSTLQSERSIRSAADYLLSHTTISKVLAMVTMTRAVKGVMEELLSEEGQSFFVHPATRYVTTGEQASFLEVASRALSNSEVLVGYRPTSSGITIVNPAAKSVPRVWGAYDLVIVCCDTASVVTPAAINLRRVQRYAGLTGLSSLFGKKKSTGEGGTNKTTLAGIVKGSGTATAKKVSVFASAAGAMSNMGKQGEQGHEGGTIGNEAAEREQEEEGEEEGEGGGGGGGGERRRGSSSSSSSSSSDSSLGTGGEDGFSDNDNDNAEDDDDDDEDDEDDDGGSSPPPMMRGLSRRTSVAMDPLLARSSPPRLAEKADGSGGGSPTNNNASSLPPLRIRGETPTIEEDDYEEDHADEASL